ncbi:uncharacterized protein LOC111635518 [Centruroides sculpturatus]|uniref:uncharacterized protein LOC111635518 n=1 Tax=Centruroides sculpturatus TaxID=218467 RepID=UPI000C6DD64A|nr:uncharacterized protein LOC111635518 [Centruroides sculpturatus]
MSLMIGMESELKIFHDNANDIIEEFKKYSLDNPNAKLGVACHSSYILTQFNRVIQLAETFIKKNSLTEYFDQKFSVLTTRKDLKELRVTQDDKTMEILTGIQETVNNLKKNFSNEILGGEKDSAPSYRDILKKGIKPISNVHEPPLQTHTVLVYSDQEGATSEQTKSYLTNHVKPHILGVGVNRLRKLKNGGIAVDLNHKDEVEYFKESVQQVPGLNSRLPKKRLPLMKIASVPKAVVKEELIQDIYEQNVCFVHLYTDKTFAEKINIRFSLKQKNRNYLSWVVEVTPEIRDILVKVGKVHIHWSTCQVYDFIPTIQCYKCLSFGHFAKNCTSTESICSHCGEKHLFKNCTNRHETPKCVNCLKEKRTQHNHNTMDKMCPTYLREKSKYLTRTEYIHT